MNEKEPQNKFDEVLENFIQNYQKEIAGFLIGAFLIGLFGLGFLFFGKSKGPIEVEKSRETLGEKVEPTEASNLIVVDVRGAVNSPGVYELPEGSRVADLLEKAGGLSEEADKDYIDKDLNLAQILTDGEKIYIHKKGEPSTNSTSSSQAGSGQGQIAGAKTSDKININTATQAQLELLPGIGPIYAKRIIENRPYKTIEEIQKVSGIGPKTFAKIKDKITVK